MTDESFLNRLQRAARDRLQEEEEARRALEKKVAQLERERAFAFRRYNVLVEMTQAATDKPDCEESVVAQVTAALLMVGWISREIDDLEELRRPVADRLSCVAQAVFDALNSSATAEGGTRPVDFNGRVIDAMTEFEEWYRMTYGAEFLAALETYVEERPLIDF